MNYELDLGLTLLFGFFLFILKFKMSDEDLHDRPASPNRAMQERERQLQERDRVIARLQRERLVRLVSAF